MSFNIDAFVTGLDRRGQVHAGNPPVEAKQRVSGGGFKLVEQPNNKYVIMRVTAYSYEGKVILSGTLKDLRSYCKELGLDYRIA